MKLLNQCKQYLLVIICCLVFASPTHSFSILAHESIIDAEWLNHIKPLLLKRYPSATEPQLKEAYANAYGGSLVADMGYMPFGCSYFTNLLHYVRSGDMLVALIDESQNLDEYAFALGALSHYMADKYGHALATNVSVPIAYPKLKKKFGETITYDNDHASHSSIEFAYDVIQTVKGNYTSTEYHNFIGFEIATPVLERAFFKTYGQHLNTVFPNFQSAIARFKWGVREFFPELARTACKPDEAGILFSKQSITRATFVNPMPVYNPGKQLNINSKIHTGLTARCVVAIINTFPNMGPLKKFKFKYPGLSCEELYLHSMDSILVNYNLALQKVAENELTLANIDFDTGKQTLVNEYTLADKTYNEWVTKLKADPSVRVTPGIQKNILAFYNITGNRKQNMANLLQGHKDKHSIKSLKMLTVN